MWQRYMDNGWQIALKFNPIVMKQSKLHYTYWDTCCVKSEFLKHKTIVKKLEIMSTLMALEIKFSQE